MKPIRVDGNKEQEAEEEAPDICTLHVSLTYINKTKKQVCRISIRKPDTLSFDEKSSLISESEHLLIKGKQESLEYLFPFQWKI